MEKFLKITSSIAPQGATQAPIVYALLEKAEAFINENDGQTTVKIGGNFFKGKVEIVEMSIESVLEEIEESNSTDEDEDDTKVIKLGK